MKRSFIKKFFTFALTCALTIGAISGSASAASRDFYNTSTKKVYTISALSDSEFSTFVDDIMSNGDNYIYEFNGKYYSYTSLLNDYLKDKKAGQDTTTAFKNCTANTTNVKSDFDPSAYNSGSNTNPDTSDFSVTSIE